MNIIRDWMILRNKKKLVRMGGVPQKKNVRGPTTCKEIHAITLDEREVVTFDLGQAVGPTDRAFCNLSNFTGTVVRNPKFITLLYTSWHGVPDETKKCMWDYVNFELENHQNTGKTPDNAFMTVFGKEKLGRVRGYGRSVIRTSLEKDEEMNELKQKHANEVTSIKEEIISEMREEMR
ncbi:hypothetical protein FXO38_14125 [Capsicum annuum]|nr:hypothetical protein FXO38_14125 [Capsicum annuum]